MSDTQLALFDLGSGETTQTGINPAHLEVGTYADNSRDAVERGRMAVGERNGDARLTNDQVQAIWQRLRIMQAPDTQRKIADEYGVGQSTISRIARGESWSTVTGAVA